jgi:hypothetical protein
MDGDNVQRSFIQGAYMIQKVVTRHDLTSRDSSKEDLAYWLTRTPEERIEAVEFLRRQYHGSFSRLQKSAHIILFNDSSQAGSRSTD